MTQAVSAQNEFLTSIKSGRAGFRKYESFALTEHAFGEFYIYGIKSSGDSAPRLDFMCNSHGSENIPKKFEGPKIINQQGFFFYL